MTVTEICPVTAKKCRVILEDGTEFVLYKNELSRYGICQGEALVPENLQKILEEVLPLRARKYAMNLLLKKDRTEKELTEKLRRAGYPAQAAQNAVDYVKSFGYIDDERYAAHFLEMGSGKESLKSLSWKLAGKGVSQEIIEKVKETFQESIDSEEVIRNLVERRLGGRKLTDEKSLRNMAAYLGRRGFSGEEIWHVLKKYRQEE